MSIAPETDNAQQPDTLQAPYIAITAQITGHTVGCICVRCEDLAAAAPHLIAEGRRLAAAELREWCEDYRRSIGAGSDPHDATARLILGDTAREAARIVEGLSPAEYAERQLRESRERQAGLDYERIERVRASRIADAAGGS